jgi:hypothetical protein
MTGSPGLQVVDDPHQAAATRWVTESVGPVGTVGAIVPPAFAAYARVLHPAYLICRDRSRPVRWSELASRSIAASTRFEDVSAQAADRDAGEELCSPVQGSLAPELIAPLVHVLGRHTRTPRRCWFAVWDGFSGVSVRHASRVRLVAPDRRYVLLRGELADAATNLDCAGFQTPNLWWPEDRAWLVTTDIDHVCTYIGASEPCITQLLATRGLEVVRVTRGDSIV